MFKNRSRKHHPDYFLLGLIFLLVVFGLVVLTSASSDLGKMKFNNSYYYLKHQVLYGLLLGLAGFATAYFLPYGNLKKLALILLAANVILLILVFTPLGIRAGGASRWLSFGSFSFQPSELLKLSFVMYIAAWLTSSHFNRGKNFYKGFLPFLAALGLVGGLLVAQPATSTVVILLAAAVVMYIVSGAEWKYILAIALIGTIALAALIYFTPYRMTRVMSFFNQSDELSNNYHLKQALIAIGSGGITGTGFGESSAKVTYLPAVIDDSIFAVLAQELGFVGAGSLVVLFALLTLRMFWLAIKTRDAFGRLLLTGFGTIIAMQSLTNMGAISGLLPLTGVPLPFVSYGGTALAVFLTMMGVTLNITKYR